MRASGFAAWRRTPAEGFSPHVHGIAVGDPTVSSAAAQQVKAFQAGRNGLADNGPDTYTGGGGGATSGAAQATAKAMLSSHGWAAAQWSPLQKLWQGESGWNYKATNPSSGAYGIPQALPGSKMASAGSDWKTNAATQIKWGEGYIKSVYGSPSAAYSKWLGRSPHWYGRGTKSAAPGWNVVGDKGIELLHTRGGETIQPLDALEARGSGNTITIPVSIDARGATPAAVDKLFNELPDRLRMALEQGTGRRN